MDQKSVEGKKIEVKQAIDKRRDRLGSRPFNSDKRRGPQPEDVCHNCKGLGHWANQCTQEKNPK
mgnify:CR=1 FL=1|jgi:hypothetical protein